VVHARCNGQRSLPAIAHRCNLHAVRGLRCVAQRVRESRDGPAHGASSLFAAAMDESCISAIASKAACLFRGWGKLQLRSARLLFPTDNTEERNMGRGNSCFGFFGRSRFPSSFCSAPVLSITSLLLPVSSGQFIIATKETPGRLPVRGLSFASEPGAVEMHRQCFFQPPTRPWFARLSTRLSPVRAWLFD